MPMPPGFKKVAPPPPFRPAEVTDVVRRSNKQVVILKVLMGVMEVVMEVVELFLAPLNHWDPPFRRSNMVIKYKCRFTSMRRRKPTESVWSKVATKYKMKMKMQWENL